MAKKTRTQKAREAYREKYFSVTVERAAGQELSAHIKSAGMKLHASMTNVIKYILARPENERRAILTGNFAGAA